MWFRKICSFEFSRNNEEKGASKIIRTFSETKFKSHCWWWKWVKPKEPHCFTSKVTLPQNYKRLAQLWSKMLFYKYECKYHSIPLKVFDVIIFFVSINKNIGSNKEIYDFLSGFKCRNCDPHQSQVWVKSNQ